MTTQADDDTSPLTVEEATHPCGACGKPVPEHQEFCTQCGARQPAVAEALSETTPVQEVAPPMDLAALEEQAASLIGQTVAFRSWSPRGRKLRAAPDPSLPLLLDIVVGRCTVIEARGAWVLLAHSTGMRGWCPVTNVKIPAVRIDRPPPPDAGAPIPELATIEALERLHALHVAGGLSDKEFARAKQLVLDSKPGA